jgi:hypothetical protein
MVTVMPNPTTGMINIKGTGMVSISVYNVLGELMKSADNTNTISIAELPDGLYYLKLYDGQGAVIDERKVIKE